MITKVCNRCNIEQSVDNFYKHIDMPDGRLNQCKECKAKYRKKQYWDNPEYARAETKRWTKENPEMKAAADKKYAEEHPEAIKINHKRFRDNNPEKMRDWYYRTKYGITANQYDVMLRNQNYVCKICLGPETRKDRGGKVKALSVDHNHTTGKVRGLLCDACNTAFGAIKENFNTALNMAKYAQEDTNCV